MSFCKISCVLRLTSLSISSHTYMNAAWMILSYHLWHEGSLPPLCIRLNSAIVNRNESISYSHQISAFSESARHSSILPISLTSRALELYLSHCLSLQHERSSSHALEELFDMS